MESVSTVMPFTLKSARALNAAKNSDELTSARVSAVENAAARRAEDVERSAREKIGTMREDTQHKEAGAHVAAANSGLEISGSPMLSLESIEHADDDAESQVLNDAAVNAQGILDSAADQVQSIRLSARNSRSGSSLLSQGSRALGF